MTDLEALRRAICHQPTEDTPRLIFADEIEVSEPARAEFIRVQVELATVPGCQVAGKVVNWGKPIRSCRDVFPKPHDDKGHGPHCEPCREFVRLRQRSDALLAAHEGTWVPDCLWTRDPEGDAPADGVGWRFGRGFIEEVRVPLGLFTEATARELFGRHPVTSVALGECNPVYEDTPVGWVKQSTYDDDPAIARHRGDFIPDHLFDRLTGGIYQQDGVTWFRYTEVAAAHADISRAAVAWGRELAGLPPLTPSTPVPTHR